MALRVHLFSPKLLPQIPKFQNHPFLSTTHVKTLKNTPRIKLSCNKSISDSEIALDLASEVEKINTQLLQREAAMNKSRELLFTELCQFMKLKEDEVKKKWMKMDEDDKWVLVKGFVSEWSLNFHPLSARSVKDMVEEYLVENNPSLTSFPSLLFPNLKKIMGF